MEFRDITKVEKIKELEDNDKVLVNRDGTLRQISKSDAKFGGGQVTIFYCKSTGNNRNPGVIYKDSSATELFTPQEAYDACMNGAVLCYPIGIVLNTIGAIVATPVRLSWQSNNTRGDVDPKNVTALVCEFSLGDGPVFAVAGTVVEK